MLAPTDVYRACGLVFFVLLLNAQPPTSAIRVQVNDPSGAPMEAAGKLDSGALGVQRDFETDSQGAYTIDHLPFGRYRLQITKAGFVPQSASVDVFSITPVTAIVTMKLETQSTKVDVVSETPLAGTELNVDQIAPRSRSQTGRKAG